MSPWAPPHRCAVSSCGVLVPRGVPRCPAHEQQRRQAYELARRFDPVRQAAQHLYASVAWKRLRAEVLDEEPVCREPRCGQPSNHADHIIALRDGGAPLDRANIQGLCLRHHSAKSARVGERWGRRG